MPEDLFDQIDKFNSTIGAPNGSLAQASVQNQGSKVITPDMGHFDPITSSYSKDQQMPTRSRFDAGLTADEDVDTHREENQNGWWLAGATVGRALGQGLAKTAQGFSMIGSAIGAGVVAGVGPDNLNAIFGSHLTDKDYSMDRIINNPVNKLFTDFEDKVKDLTPVYTKPDYNKKSTADKFFNNFGEWMAQDGADMVGFALSMAIPAGAASKIGLGATLLGDASRGATALSEALTAAGATEKVLSAASKGVDLATQYAAHSSVESMFMAKDTGKQIMEKYLENINSKLPSNQQFKSVTDMPKNMQDDLNAKMSSGMKNDFWWNMLAGTPANIFEIGLINKFLGKAGGLASSVAKDIDAGATIADEATRVTNAFDGLGSGRFKTLTKSISDAANTVGKTRIGSALKDVPKGVLYEGLFKANLQTQLNELSTQYGLEGKSGYFLQSGLEAGKNILASVNPENWNDPKYQSARDAMFSGAVLGAVLGGVTSATVGHNQEIAAHAHHNEAVGKAIDYLNTAKSDFLSQDQFVTKDVPQEDGSVKKAIQFDDKGPIANQTDIANFLGNQSRMSDLVNSEEYYTTTGQKEMSSIVRNERTTNWALAHLQTGKEDDMFSKLDDLAKAKPDDLVKLGFDPTFYGDDGQARSIGQRVAEIRDKVASVKNIYDKVTDNIPSDQVARIEELVRLKSRQDEMSKHQDTLEAQKQDLIDSTQEPHVRDLEDLQSRLDAHEEHSKYLDERTKSLEDRKAALDDIDTKSLAKEEKDALDRLKTSHDYEHAEIQSLKGFNKQNIDTVKQGIDERKTQFKEQLDAKGFNSTVGDYSPVTGRISQDLKNTNDKLAQLGGAIHEHANEYNQLMKPFDGAVRFEQRLKSSFDKQLVSDAADNANTQATTLPVSEHEARPAPPVVNPNNTITSQPEVKPEVVHTKPEFLPNSRLTLDNGKANRADEIKQAMTTEGRTDPNKIAKFATDNEGTRLDIRPFKNRNSGQDIDGTKFGATIRGTITNGKFISDKGIEMPIERLAGSSIGDIRILTPTVSPVVKTETKTTEATIPVITTEKQKEFHDQMYSSSKPYVAVAINSTTGIDNGADPHQERWFRTTENLNLRDGKYQLMTVTKQNELASKALLGDDWNDALLYDENTIKTVLLKDGKPVKYNQFGDEDPNGDIAFTSLPLNPDKSKIAIVEHRTLEQKLPEYTYQGDQTARFITTEDEVKSGTLEDLLLRHAEWRKEVLANPDTKVYNVSSKGSGIRVKGELGPVTGRLTEDKSVKVTLATDNVIKDAQGKDITVKAGLAYTEHKGMVVPLTGRRLTTDEIAVTKEALKQWSQANSKNTINNFVKQLSEAVHNKDTKLANELREKLRGKDISTLPVDVKDLIAGKGNITNEELQQLYDHGLHITDERNSLKSFLENSVRLGDTDEYGIHIDKGNLVFGKDSIPQEDLWNGNTAKLDEFLKEKYINVANRPLSTNEPYTEYVLNKGQLEPRKWNNYHEYLTSNELPDGSPRESNSIPLRTQLAPLGEAQFKSVNLRFTNLTDAVKPERNDTRAIQQIAKPVEEAKGFSQDDFVDKVNKFEEGKTYEIEIKNRDSSKIQDSFYYRFKKEDEEVKFVDRTKMNGEVVKDLPSSANLLMEQLNNTELAKKIDPGFKVVNIKELGDIQDEPVIVEPKAETESVQESIPDDYQENSSYHNEDLIDKTYNEVISEINKVGIFKGVPSDLDEYIQSVKEAYPEIPSSDIAKSYIENNPADISSTKPLPNISPVKRRVMRGMAKDTTLYKPINLDKEEAWFKERFPNVDFKRVNGLIQGRYWGLFDSAMGVLVSTDATSGTTYHEAFHTASLLYHTKAERDAVYNEYRQRTGEIGSNTVIEEKLAEEFREYVQSEGKYTFPDKRQNFFQKLWHTIKSFFTNKQSIEDLFNKINSGHFAQQEISNDLGVQTSAPRTADLVHTASETHAILDDMTVSFFSHFFEDGHTIDSLFNIFNEGKVSMLLEGKEGIYDKMLADYKSIIDPNSPTILDKIVEPENWRDKVRLHKETLANLGLKLINKVASDNTAAEVNPVDLEIEGGKDNAQFESHVEFSSKEGMPKIVKFFLSSLPELENGEDGIQHKLSTYGTLKLADPEKLMNTLGNSLAGMTDIKEMVDKIKELSIDYPTLTRLISRMQVGDELFPVTATDNEANFTGMFWQQFAKTNHDYYITYLSEDGRVDMINANSARQEQVTRDRWRDNIQTELRSENSILKEQDNKIVVDKTKVRQLSRYTDPFEQASKLGINFTHPDKIRANETMFKTLNENLSKIIQIVSNPEYKVTDIFSNSDSPVRSRINKLTELEALTNPDATERQHIAIDGKTNYNLTLNNSLSLGIEEFNNRSGKLYEAAKSGNNNSVVLDKLSKNPNYNIELSISSGMKRQTADGTETAKLTPTDALANTINGVLKGMHSLLRPGDKKLEYKMKLGEFVAADKLVTQDGKYTQEVNKTFRGYIKDEFNRIFNVQEGIGSNIQYYKDSAIDKDGNYNLGIFNDVLKDINIPHFESREEANTWIDENKDLIDSKVNAFLTDTTNRFGEAARKYSIFKQLSEGTGRKRVLKPDNYIVNGIDTREINKILKNDNTVFTGKEIHQFFRYIAVNSLIGNIEQTKILTGDLAFYKDPLKRFSALTGTKKMSMIDASFNNWLKANHEKIGYIGNEKINLHQEGKIHIAVVKDVFSSIRPETRANFKEGLLANGMSEVEAEKVAIKYDRINEADAQSWIHLPAYKELLQRSFGWTNAHEAAYKKAIRGIPLNADEIFLFPPLKPQYFGQQEANGLYAPYFLKTSLSPLIPSVVKGTDLEVLMHKMYKDDVDITSTESAVKLGGKIDTSTGDFMPMYTNVDGKAVINPTSFNATGENGLETVVSKLPYQYMGIQLDMAPERKEQTTRGTQDEKLTMSNLANIPGGEEILSNYKKTIDGLVTLAKGKMIQDFGIKVQGNKYSIPDKTKLLDFLEKQAISRGVPTNTLIGLRKALTEGSSLDAVVNKDRIDNILAAIVNNNTIKAKRRGEQKVQVASTGVGTREFSKGTTLHTDDSLAPYVYDPKGTKPMEVRVALPKALVPYVEKIGGLEAFNKLIADGKVDERILKGVGFRIPTQQLSSMIYYKVKEFLPYEAGNIVHLPSLITTIAGSDFDIDKLTMYEKNYNIKYEGLKGIDFRPALRKELTNAGLIDQFKTVMNKWPEQLSDDELSNLVQYSKDTIDENEGDKMDDIIVKLQKKYATKPSLQYIESNGDTEKALQNRMVELKEQMLEHPANFKNLIAPIGNEVLSGLADKMVSLVGDNQTDNYNSAKLMKMDYLLEQGQRFQAGKDLLGIAAKQNTHHVLAQIAKLEVQPSTQVWFDSMVDQDMNMHRVNDVNNVHQISDIVSEFINGFVDIVKDQFTYDLNANKDTINHFFYLTRLGVPIEETTSFLNQPVIRKYIAERNVNNSLIAEGLPEAYQKSNYDIVNELRKEYVTKARVSSDISTKAFDDRLPYYYEEDEARDKVRSRYPNFKLSELDDMIKDDTTPKNALRQLVVLDQFLQYGKDGAELTNLMMLNSQDTDGVNKSLTRSFVEKQMYQKMINNGKSIFTNARDIVDKTLIKPYFNVVMEAESYFKDLFDSKSDKSNELRQQLVHMLGNNGIDDITDNVKKFESFMTAHLLQNTVTGEMNVPLSAELSQVLMGSNSAASSMLKLRAKLAKDKTPNDAIDALSAIKGADRTKGNYVDSIRLNNKRMNKQQADILSGAMSDLLNENPDIAKKIFKATLVQSGLNNSYMSYHNLLPAEWFHRMVSNVMDVYRNSDLPMRNVLDDYFRNNWKDSTLVPKVKNRATNNLPDGGISISLKNGQYNDKIYLKRWTMPEGIDKKTFFSQRADETIADVDKPNWELALYKYHDNDGKDMFFKRVNPLGLSERAQETSREWKSKSLWNQNNKIDGELVSSQNYLEYTNYKPTEQTESDIIIPSPVMNRLSEVVGTSHDTLGEATQAQDTLARASDKYKESKLAGMTDKQAEDAAMMEIKCNF